MGQDSGQQVGDAAEARIVLEPRPTTAIGISGVVYDSSSRAPVGGASVALADLDGRLLPDACLAPGQQNQSSGCQRRLSV